MTTQYNFYKVEKKAPIAWVFLNRPEKKNAMGPDAWKEIIPIFADIDADESTRVAIIAGEGKDLSTGIDIMGMAPMIPTMKNWDMSAKGKVRLFKDIFPLQDAMTSVEKCSKPVICCFHGYSIGAALDLGSACDIRLASEDARISLREAAVSFIADVGVLQRLPHIVGQGITREMAFTAKFIDAKRAREVNLVNEVYPDKDALLKGAESLALEIAQCAPLAVQGAKEVLNFCRGQSIADGLEYVAARSAMVLPSEDIAETMTAFMEKRKPVYKGN
ncbi:MAG TPA: crotonase/enoyl-CoA hydratase family protein [Deltaproteobacteria bacterium]|jgi:enoyl-CoA hydratase|nr:crotonase/enoyl-CoA hydratase family protein [Deltaproteobacteria bacterium]OQC23019.1 MAG: 2,3-dehydroadipyl-CoA hydratase [Deltaproteobacteria bacterium ADurb.Bin072]HRW79794.1 crotonase/enoyl-CoA hydratase family protein [Desulfomonilia bacterium]HNQ85735.1 crotonase/enoyl-CoA hydratase family protein [Deltaproteobacteria bacterium]HNS90052.1 crotonase/enoyl-CoA hydratase family protein [Deltaproteobacteria bacterium]